MALNIKNDEVERLATEASTRYKETKTEAIRIALEQRLEREPSKASKEERLESLMNYLRTEVWPKIAPEERGKPMTKAEREEILGYGPDGV